MSNAFPIIDDALMSSFDLIALFTNTPKPVQLLQYRLVKTNRRLTFDILYQHAATRNMGPDIGPTSGLKFIASNGYEIVSRSRMDIQTERVWLLGSKENMRSGSMVFSDNDKRDIAHHEFSKALQEWAESYNHLTYET